MTVKKRGKRGIWQISFMIRGVRYRESCPEARTKQEALDAEADMRRSVYEGRYGRRSKAIPFEKFVEDVFKPYARINRKRHEQDERIITRFVTMFKGRSLTEIPPMLIEQAKKKLSTELKENGEARKPSTVNQMLAVLRRVFSLAVENKLLVDNPMTHVRMYKLGQMSDRVMSVEEELRLRSVMVDHFPLGIFFEIAVNTGMRQQEICGLSLSEVDFQKRVIHLRPERTKERKEKLIPLNPVVYELLSSRKDEVRTYFVGVTASHIRHLWRSACIQAQVEGLTIHHIRHTVSTRMAEAGVPDAVRMVLFGHSTEKMTRHYTHPGIESLGQAVNSLLQVCHTEKVKEGNFR